MALKNNIEKLFGYRLNPKQVPSIIAKSVLEELFPGHLYLGVLGFGSEACVLKTNAWVEELDSRGNLVRNRMNLAVKIAAEDFVRKDYDRVNFYSARVEKPNRERARFLNGINCQKMVSELVKTPFSLVIPKVYEVKEEPWLACSMGFIEGIPLLQYLEENKDFIQSLKLYLRLLEGVQDLHIAKIIHRDLKPENMYVCGNRQLHPQIALLDWTSSKLLGVGWSNTIPGTSLGTVPYASDKMVIEGKSQDASEEDDVEPLSVMIYEFSNFSKIPPPPSSLCQPSDIATSKDAKKKYREWVKNSIPKDLHNVYDCGGNDKFKTVGPLIHELGKSFLAMDFNKVELKTIEGTIEDRVLRLENILEKISKALDEAI
jgi:serine/threonine protein kinase